MACYSDILVFLLWYGGILAGKVLPPSVDWGFNARPGNEMARAIPQMEEEKIG